MRKTLFTIIIGALLLSSCAKTTPSSKTCLCFKNNHINLQKGEKIDLRELITKDFDLEDILFSKNNNILEIEKDYIINPKEVGEVILTAKNKNNAIDEIKINVIDYPLADGDYNFFDIYNDKDETFELYSVLEQYAINNHLTGVPLFGLKDKSIELGQYHFLKLYVNGCTDELRNSIFNNEYQDNTEVTRKLPYSSKPILQNENFYDGLIACINRQELVEKNHQEDDALATLVSFDKYDVVPTDFNFPNSVGEQEAQIIKEGNHYSLLDYTNTESFKNNFKTILYEADQYGYSLNKAQSLFKKAADELIENKSYVSGEQINLEFVVNANEYDLIPLKDFQLIVKYIEDAFNSSTDKLSLKINIIEFNIGESISLIGAYDLFTYYSPLFWPNEFHPFATFTRGDNSSDTVLNTFQNINTNEKADIFYKGKRFSYSALVNAVYGFKSDVYQSAHIINGLLAKNH